MGATISALRTGRSKLRPYEYSTITLKGENQATKDAPGVAVSGPYHDQSAEVYIIQSGSGVLTTGAMAEKRPSGNYNLLNGPGGSGTAAPNAYSRRANPGDIIIIPPGVLHAWSQIMDHVTYLSVRPDPDRVLPGGYVNPPLLKNQPAPAK